MPETHRIFSDGLEIWTECLGQRSNPAVLLIAGAGAHAHFWTNSFCAEFLKHKFFVIRYDHRDVGLSQGTQADYDLMALARDAASILQAYEITKAHVVGHSMGGYIAQYLASYFPAYVLSATLISSGPAATTPLLRESLAKEDRDHLMETWRIMLQNRPTASFEESWEGYLRVWQRLSGKIALEEALAKMYTKELFERCFSKPEMHSKHLKVMEKVAAELESRKELFVNFRAPFLIIQGLEDYLVLPKKGGIALKEAIPSARLELIANMGHLFFNYDLEKLIAEKIISFISSISFPE